ncbi:GNAT family N-acetyltransferase [Agrilactobacillus fermenti]|uniref:GNAT family N-acetyltransferase n=1 Tax=Agrilactobacillus fermenti TaxID=2586909 RepID=UPI001E5C4B88|nr:GNAT family N-acetyltransferase [Agrilactobacillus fermenti]MCD2256350.1 GNAT family N-acetyltransferase [Agrilactobacillus fermenti]
MTQLSFRHPKLIDLPQIMTIEQSGFTPAEAATAIAMKQRLLTIPDTFVVAVNEKDQPLGYVVGPVIAARYLTDTLFSAIQPNPKIGGYIGVLSLAVAPDYQRQGIGSQLLTALAKLGQQQQRRGVTLTCLQRLIPFYEQNGYRNEGISMSQHAGETWYNLVLDLALNQNGDQNTTEHDKD